MIRKRTRIVCWSIMLIPFVATGILFTTQECFPYLYLKAWGTSKNDTSYLRALEKEYEDSCQKLQSALNKGEIPYYEMKVDGEPRIYYRSGKHDTRRERWVIISDKIDFLESRGFSNFFKFRDTVKFPPHIWWKYKKQGGLHHR